MVQGKWASHLHCSSSPGQTTILCCFLHCRLVVSICIPSAVLVFKHVIRIQISGAGSAWAGLCHGLRFDVFLCRCGGWSHRCLRSPTTRRLAVNDIKTDLHHAVCLLQCREQFWFAVYCATMVTCWTVFLCVRECQACYGLLLSSCQTSNIHGPGIFEIFLLLVWWLTGWRSPSKPLRFDRQSLAVRVTSENRWVTCLQNEKSPDQTWRRPGCFFVLNSFDKDVKFEGCLKLFHGFHMFSLSKCMAFGELNSWNGVGLSAVL